MPDVPKPPRHLSREAEAWWRAVLAEYDLGPSDLKLLQAAAEAWDRAQEARQIVERDGAYVRDRFDQLKSHPAVEVERASRAQFEKLLRALRLDGVAAGELPASGAPVPLPALPAPSTMRAA